MIKNIPFFFNFGDQNHNYSKFQELKILFKIINDFFFFSETKSNKIIFTRNLNIFKS